MCRCQLASAIASTRPIPAKTRAPGVRSRSSAQQPTAPANVKEIENAFRALPGTIPEIAAFEWGTNNSPEGLAQGFTHCFFVSFRDAKGREAYLPHPAHQAFVDVLKPHLDKVLVIDYDATQ